MDKVIFLVDMNAFFISCEMTRNPDLIGRPAAVAGDPKKRTGIILAANYEARKYGVKTAMVLHKALSLCPDMLLVPPNHSFYQEKSNEVMSLLSNYSPIIEQNSIDEAWLDMSGTEGLFGKPVEAAKIIMDDIKDNLGLWCSIGISENKFLSKMASDMKKPLGITELWKSDVQLRLWPLPVRTMYGIGGKTAEKLNSMGIKTIGELAKFDINYLKKVFGKQAIDLHQQANGEDSSRLEISSHEVKSIGRSTTLPEDVADINRLRNILLELAEDVGMKARELNKKGTTIQITLKYTSFQSITRQTTIAPTYATKTIYEVGYDLLKRNFSSNRPIRLIGISLSGFEEATISQQISLFEEIKDGKDEKIDEVMDKIRNKYGFNKINRGSLIKK